MKEKQFEFDFMKDIHKAQGQVCLKCIQFNSKDSTCDLENGEVDPKGNCEFWDYNTDWGMSEIEEECKAEFNQIMDKYSVSAEDKDRIYNDCQWF